MSPFLTSFQLKLWSAPATPRSLNSAHFPHSTSSGRGQCAKCQPDGRQNVEPHIPGIARPRKRIKLGSYTEHKEVALFASQRFLEEGGNRFGHSSRWSCFSLDVSAASLNDCLIPVRKPECPVPNGFPVTLGLHRHADGGKIEIYDRIRSSRIRRRSATQLRRL